MVVNGVWRDEICYHSVSHIEPDVLLDLSVVERNVGKAAVKIVDCDFGGIVPRRHGGVIIGLRRELEKGIILIENLVAAINRVNVHVTERVVKDGAVQPLVIGDVGERASLKNVRVADVTVDRRVVLVDWSLDLVYHEVCDSRVWIVHLLGDLHSFPARQNLELIHVSCIRSVELTGIEVNRRKRDCGLEVTLIVVGVVLEIEGV